MRSFLLKAIEKSTSDLHNSLHFHHIISQLHLLLTLKKGRRYDKETFVLAAELFNISPAAYKMLRNSGSVALPGLRLIRQLLSRSFNDNNLKTLLHNLPP